MTGGAIEGDKCACPPKVTATEMNMSSGSCVEYSPAPLCMHTDAVQWHFDCAMVEMDCSVPAGTRVSRWKFVAGALSRFFFLNSHKIPTFGLICKLKWQAHPRVPKFFRVFSYFSEVVYISQRVRYSSVSDGV